MSSDAPVPDETSRTEQDQAVDQLVEDIEETLPEFFFDMYKLAVEMADRISARRTTANAFFATVNTGLLAIVGSQDLVWYVPLAGIALTYTWFSLLLSYRDLNGAKFEIINEVEERLPIKVFADEWVRLKARREVRTGRMRGTRQRLAGYREQGQVERQVPLIFMALYLLAFLIEIGLLG